MTSWGPSWSVPDETESARRSLESPPPPALARKCFHEFSCNVLSQQAPHTVAVFANSAQSVPQLHTGVKNTHTHTHIEKEVYVLHPPPSLSLGSFLMSKGF